MRLINVGHAGLNVLGADRAVVSCRDVGGLRLAEHGANAAHLGYGRRT